GDVYKRQALLGVRLREREHERPIRAIAAGRTVETHYKDGRARVFLPPDSVAQALDSAYVAATARSPIIVAVTEEQEETDDFLLFWDAHGKLLRCIPSTRDTPFDAVAEEGSELYWRKWYRSIHPPSKRHDTFDVTEGAHYYPSTLRRFAIASSEIEETYRLYHAGHVNSIVYAPSFDSTATWLWMTGRVRDGGLLREIAGGVEQNTHFLACFEDSARGTEYFPAFAPPSAAFLHNHPEGVRPAVPILYFVIRGFLSDGDSILWDRSPSMLIHEVVRAGPQDLEVLLMGAIRLDLHRPGTGRVEVQASTSGQAHPAIARRARALGVDAEEAVRRFLADSVIVLIASAPGLEVTGDFTDRRGAVPTQWNGALPGWTEDRPVSR
ncbi:MAG: hypothetical protein QUU85_02375, partial [Candidatus Eisenbacteria bacterium]|nr:hypothetical protein [Candidatus Eisenbacteria bacterium]